MITVHADDWMGKYIQVWLNGENLSNCTFLAVLPDKPGIVGEGELHTFAVDGDSFKVKADENGDPEIETEILKGLVCWQWREDAPAWVKERELA